MNIGRRISTMIHKRSPKDDEGNGSDDDGPDDEIPVKVGSPESAIHAQNNNSPSTASREMDPSQGETAGGENESTGTPGPNIGLLIGISAVIASFLLIFLFFFILKRRKIAAKAAAKKRYEITMANSVRPYSPKTAPALSLAHQEPFGVFERFSALFSLQNPSSGLIANHPWENLDEADQYENQATLNDVEMPAPTVNAKYPSSFPIPEETVIDSNNLYLHATIEFPTSIKESGRHGL